MTEREHEKQQLGERIRAERERLGMSQEEFGALAHTTRITQAQYEKGIREPKHSYFKALEAHAVDIQFLVLGRPGIEQTLENPKFLEVEKAAFRLLMSTLKAHKIDMTTLSSETLHVAFIGLRDQLLDRPSVVPEEQRKLA